MSIPNLSLSQIYPPAAGEINFNTCHDPDCGNHGVGADFQVSRILGRNAAKRRAALLSNAAAVGLGSNNLHGTAGKEYRRISTVFEYEKQPHKWLDRKLVECQFDHGAGPCGMHFELLLNEHLADEIDRLRQANGIFVSPTCRACGKDYLAAPAESILDGAETRSARPRRPGKMGIVSAPRMAPHSIGSGSFTSPTRSCMAEAGLSAAE